MLTDNIWQILALVVGPAGASWVGVKVALNGARADIREIKDDMRTLHTKVDQHHTRLAVIEIGCQMRHPPRDLTDPAA